MSKSQLLDVSLTADTLEISIGRNALINFLKSSDQWPINEDTNKPLKIEDREIFLDSLVTFLMNEDENGATVIHNAIETACIEMIENGEGGLEDPEPQDLDDDVDDGYNHSDWN